MTYCPLSNWWMETFRPRYWKHCCLSWVQLMWRCHYSPADRTARYSDSYSAAQALRFAPAAWPSGASERQSGPSGSPLGEWEMPSAQVGWPSGVSEMPSAQAESPFARQQILPPPRAAGASKSIHLFFLSFEASSNTDNASFNSRLVSTGSSYGWYPVEAVDHGRRLGRQTTFPELGIYTALGSGGRSDPFTGAASDASPPKDGEENAWTILFRTAYKTNSLTECSPSLLMMLLRCVSAVFTLRFSTEATSLVLFPSASNWTTCFSRLVSVSFSADRRWPRRSWRNTA